LDQITVRILKKKFRATFIEGVTVVANDMTDILIGTFLTGWDTLALCRIQQICINGIPTGISMFERIIEDVKGLQIRNRQRSKKELMDRAKIYNYIPKRVYRVCGWVLQEYLIKSSDSGREN
jgi:hypothetical protein